MTESDSDSGIQEAARKDCKRLEESCLFNSYMCLEWLRYLRIVDGVFVLIPLVFGGVISFAVVNGMKLTGWFALPVFGAAILPLAHSALRLERYVACYTRGHTQYKKLRDKFRRTAELIEHGAWDSQVEYRYQTTIEALDELRNDCTSPPEFVFRSVRRKFNRGDLEWTSDVTDRANTPSDRTATVIE